MRYSHMLPFMTKEIYFLTSSACETLSVCRTIEKAGHSAYAEPLIGLVRTIGDSYCWQFLTSIFLSGLAFT